MNRMEKIATSSTLKAAAYAACKLDIPSNGIRFVNSSHKTIPKLYTSTLLL